MKELVILSGKGGTGKTSLTAAFAHLAENRILCDADVDAADMHLLMQPDIKTTNGFSGGGIAEIDPLKCTQCGLCQDLCNWDAISDSFQVSDIDCEGCGVCAHFCPEEAIAFLPKECGKWFVSDTRMGPMVHARLGIAEENSGKLVSMVRQATKKIAKERGIDLILTDGPPGVGCPVIASMGGATAVLVISEPTVSGFHDMERVLRLADHFNVPAMICINKFDLNLEKTREIEIFAAEKNVPVMGRIPFDPVFTKSMVKGLTLLEYTDNSELSTNIKKVWERVLSHFNGPLNEKKEFIKASVPPQSNQG